MAVVLTRKGGGGGKAEGVAFTPAGTIAATDVQAALEEIASEAGTFIGLPVALTAHHPVALQASGTNAVANQAFAFPIVIPAEMKVRGVLVDISTSAAGIIEWGLFDYSSNPAAATKLAGGSGAPGTTGYLSIPATGGPVTVGPGCYMLVIKQPAATMPTIRGGAWTSAIPWNQTWTGYTWDDTPDFTNANWVASTLMLNVCLEGDLNDSGTRWT